MTSSTNDLPWRRSRSCGNSGCIEVAKVGDSYLVRDSKNPDTPPLSFTVEEWQRFAEGVAAGEFDPATWQ